MAVCAYSAKVDMTQDEIIEMARQAGMEQDGDMWFSNLYKTDMDVHISHLEAFAKLVAAKRTWVGLSDDEHCDIWYKESLDWMEYGKTIEAKLKEKNCVG